MEIGVLFRECFKGRSLGVEIITSSGPKKGTSSFLSTTLTKLESTGIVLFGVFDVNLFATKIYRFKVPNLGYKARYFNSSTDYCAEYGEDSSNHVPAYTPPLGCCIQPTFEETKCSTCLVKYPADNRGSRNLPKTTI